MLLAKIFTVILIIFYSATQSLEKDEVVTAFTLIVPLFTAYLTAMLKDTLANPYKDKKTDKKVEIRRVKTSIVMTTFIVFPVYFLAIFGILTFTAMGIPEFSGDGLKQAIAILEGSFGVYIGLIVFSLFKAKQEKAEDKKD